MKESNVQREQHPSYSDRVLDVLGAKQRKGPLTRHGSTLLGRMLDRHVARQTQGPQTAHRSRRACPTRHEHGHSGEPRNHQKDRANTSEQFIIWVTKHVWYRKCGSLTTLSTCQLWYNAKYQPTSHHSLQWTPPPHCVLPSCGRRARRGAATGAMKQEVQTTAGQIIEHAGGHHSDARKELRWSPF